MQKIKQSYLYLLAYTFETIITTDVCGAKQKHVSKGYGSCRYWINRKIEHEDDLDEIEIDLLEEVGKTIDGEVQKISIIAFSLIREKEFDNWEE